MRKTLDLKSDNSKKETATTEEQRMSLHEILALGYNYDPQAEVPVKAGVLTELISIANLYLEDNQERVLQKLPKIEDGQIVGYNNMTSIVMKGAAPHVDEFIGKVIEPLAVDHYYGGYFMKMTPDQMEMVDAAQDPEMEPQTCEKEQCPNHDCCSDSKPDTKEERPN